MVPDRVHNDHVLLRTRASRELLGVVRAPVICLHAAGDEDKSPMEPTSCRELHCEACPALAGEGEGGRGVSAVFRYLAIQAYKTQRSTPSTTLALQRPITDRYTACPAHPLPRQHTMMIKKKKAVQRLTQTATTQTLERAQDEGAA